jgi:hypothetical protein
MEVDLTFVHRIIFQYDFSGYYAAVTSFMAGNSPYPNMFSPPSALVVIFPFAFFSFQTARILYFLFNIGLLLYTLSRFGREIGLDSLHISYLRLIALLYFPFLMLADRGNVDGLVVSFAMLAFICRRPISRGVFLGLSVAMKLYSGLLIIVLLRRREFRFGILCILALLIFQIPFLRYESGFLQTITNRGSSVRLFGNLSPYLLFELFIGGLKGTATYLLFWIGTFAYRLVRDRSSKHPNLWVDYIPWMISLPLIVLPYEGVFLLPLLAVYAKRFETEDFSGPEGLLLPGFVLTGFQPIAASSLFGAGRAYFELINIVGLVLIMIAITFAPEPEEARLETGVV